ncbi:MAG: hypothetical protein PWP27_2694 [Clostridiales bacterium]|nr:hypothetical protein [Clostridiales bacterium]
MERIKKKLHYILGNVYIPKHILACEERILLHVSDTPAIFFSALNKLVKELCPKYIIHSGDLVDNIKLERYPNKIHEYKKKVRTIVQILENSTAKDVYIALGNHDHKDIVQKVVTRSVIIEKSKKIRIDDLDITVSHYLSEVIKNASKYNFFGHDITLGSKMDHGNIYLNGITSINLIALESKQIFALPYPYGIDDSRLCRSKIGF